MSDGDPHRLANRLKNQVERIKTSDKISSHNKGLLREFKEYMESQELTDGRISRYLSIWRIILEKGDEDLKMDEASKKDLVRIVGKINKNKIKKFAPGTKKEYKKGVRKFYTDFMAFNEPEKGWYKSCDFFSLTVKKSYLDPDRLPKPGHVEKMVKTADRMRDKTFVMALWSTGARIGAILGLKWKDIKLRHQGGKVVFRDTKTAEDRVVPLLEGYLYFRDFKEHDHRGDDPEAFVFRGVRTDDQLTHNGACMILKRLKERAEIPDGMGAWERPAP
ncbi:MAG: site-specific integrase [Candidatus Nanohaloarchaea archaeon]|nr:site-specific integrase [Candidatus Nanohaloarchaea archaeon]